MAREKSLEIDVKGFENAMHKQRKRSRGAAAEADKGLIELKENIGDSSEFVGYQSDEIESKVVYSDTDKLILTQTPFYAEAGGQIGDTGQITTGKTCFLVKNTLRSGDHIVHIGSFESDKIIEAGTSVIAQLDSERRRAIERNHTATHLLHKALQYGERLLQLRNMLMAFSQLGIRIAHNIHQRSY